ncbi:hypothetical protein D3C84_727050 [compost metagenome]
MHLHQRPRQAHVGQSSHHPGTQLLMVEQMPEQQDDQQFEQSIKYRLPATMPTRGLTEQPSQGVRQLWQLIQGQHQQLGKRSTYRIADAAVKQHRRAQQLSTFSLTGDELMTTRARQENQARANQEQVTFARPFERDSATLQQMNKTALIGPIIGRHTTQLAAVKQVCSYAEL